jgi:zona occludens toxin
MSIVAYVGLQGSGKTLQVVKEVIIPQYKSGRRIITNISGLNVELIKDYLEKKNKDIDPATFGEIIIVDDDTISLPNFFPTDDINAKTIAKRGDFIVVDEAWKQFSGKFSKLTKDHLMFFAKHRQYTHPETNISMDLVIIVQDISMVHRELRYLIEFTFKTKKLKALGLSSKFTVFTYEGNRLIQPNLISTVTRSYDKEISLYINPTRQEKGKKLKWIDALEMF